jgi:sigma-B regulation protein RsbU (phosphoserine phosphatase)
MGSFTDSFLREQLVDRRQRLQSALTVSQQAGSLVALLNEVDSALARMEEGTYGLCESCHEPVETARLLADPLVRYCLDHLTPDQRRGLQEDLELAAQIQRELLPQQHSVFEGWQVSYHYKTLGPVSGDYCDVIAGANDGKDLFFILGDASGKGVAASMLMAHLHAIIRTLIATGSPLDQLVERASRIFCESTVSPYFATLVCGRARASGEIELCNAGHCPPLLVQPGKVTKFEATGLPLGLFCDGQYSTQTVTLGPGDSLLLYTDGLTEAGNVAGEEYGEERLRRLTGERHTLRAEALVDACLKDLATFLAGMPLKDDLTLMAIRRMDKTGN